MKSRSFIFGVALFSVLCGFYWLTYNGIHISNDERYLFDSTESFVRRGDFRLTYMFDLRPRTQLTDGRPWPPAAHEPLQPILAAPLFLSAQSIPKIGLIHTVWVFNILITALTAVMLFGLALARGHRISVAWIGALLFGVATMAWPYTRTFFREPLMSLFTLVCFAAAWQVREASRYEKRVAWIALIISFLGAYLTKAVSLVLLPGLIVTLLPRLPLSRRQWSSLILFMGLIIASVLVMMLVIDVDSQRFRINKWTSNLDDFEWQHVLESFVGYQISPARGIWFYSPVLLLALWGIYLRRDEWRLIAGILIAFVLTSLSYGVTLSIEWWGGHSWGPRYLIPFVPLLMLYVFPVIERLIDTKWRIPVGLLVVISIGVQLLGMWVSVPKYYETLARQGVVVWDEGLWSWKWSPFYQHFQLLELNSPEVAWHFSDQPIWAVILLAGLTIIAGISVWISQGRRRVFSGIVSVLLLVSAIGCGLYVLRNDPRYTFNNSNTMLLIEKLEDEVDAEDAVFLEENNYQMAFMNYFKTPVLFISLPSAPGENFNPEVTQSLATLPISQQLGRGTPFVLDWTADHYKFLWVILGKSAAVPNALRPTERYLVERYYPVTSIYVSDLVRAVKFYTLDVPLGTPEIQQNYQFSDQLSLIGFDLPLGVEYQGGDIIPVSLVWQPLQPLTVDYVVSVRISPSNNPDFLIVQHDGIPQSTFGYTSRWTPDQTYRDNYGLEVSKNLAADGEYLLRVVVYTYPDLTRLGVTPGETDYATLSLLTIRH